MSIINQPTIYNTPTIYNAGGGGGGEPVPNPDIYKVADGLQRNDRGALNIAGIDFLIGENDNVIFDLYYTTSGSGIMELWYTDRRGCGIQMQNSTTLRFYGLSSSIFIDNVNQPEFYHIEATKDNKFVINGDLKTVGTFSAGERRITQLFNDSYGYSNGSVLQSIKVNDHDGNTKYRFFPVKRISDGKKGMLEVYTDSFVMASDSWKLVGIHP